MEIYSITPGDRSIRGVVTAGILTGCQRRTTEQTHGTKANDGRNLLGSGRGEPS